MDYITRTIAQFIQKLRDADPKDVPLIQMQIESLFHLQYKDKLERKWRRIVYRQQRNPKIVDDSQKDLFD